MSESDLDALLAGHGQDELDEELRAPRRLKTAANIVQAMRWLSRQMLSGKIPGERGLATMRGLRLLLDTVTEVEPAELELSVQRRLEAAQIDREENQQLKKRLARFEDVDAEQEVEPSTGLFLRGAEPVQVVDRRSANLPEVSQPEEPEEVEPMSTAVAILSDAARAKTEEVRQW